MDRQIRTREINTSARKIEENSGSKTPTQPEIFSARELLELHRLALPAAQTEASECVYCLLDARPLTPAQCQQLQMYLKKAGRDHDIALLCGLQALEPRFTPCLNLMAAAPPDTPSHQKNEPAIALLMQAQAWGLAFAVQVGFMLTPEVAKALAEVMRLPDSGVIGVVYPDALPPSSQEVFDCLGECMSDSTRLRWVKASPGCLPLFQNHGVESLLLRPMRELPSADQLARVLMLGGTGSVALMCDEPRWHSELVKQLSKANRLLPPLKQVHSLDLNTYSTQEVMMFADDPELRLSIVEQVFGIPGLLHLSLPSIHWLIGLDARTLRALVRKQGLEELRFARPYQSYSGAHPPFDRHGIPLSRRGMCDREILVAHMLDSVEPLLQRHRARRRMRQQQEAVLCQVAPHFWSVATAQFRDSPTASTALKFSLGGNIAPMASAILALGPAALGLAGVNTATAAAARRARAQLGLGQPAPQAHEAAHQKQASRCSVQ